MHATLAPSGGQPTHRLKKLLQHSFLYNISNFLNDPFNFASRNVNKFIFLTGNLLYMLYFQFRCIDLSCLFIWLKGQLGIYIQDREYVYRSKLELYSCSEFI